MLAFCLPNTSSPFLIENIFLKIKSRKKGVWLKSISGPPVLQGFISLTYHNQFPQRFLVTCKNLLLISFGINFNNPVKSHGIIARASACNIIFICWTSSIFCKEQRMELVLEIQQTKEMFSESPLLGNCVLSH